MRGPLSRGAGAVGSDRPLHGDNLILVLLSTLDAQELGPRAHLSPYPVLPFLAFGRRLERLQRALPGIGTRLSELAGNDVGERLGPVVSDRLLDVGEDLRAHVRAESRNVWGLGVLGFQIGG